MSIPLHSESKTDSAKSRARAREANFCEHAHGDRTDAAELPGRSTLAQFYDAVILTGIGFTMSLFIGTLAFDDEAIMVQVRLGALIASLLSGIAATAVLVLVHRSMRSPAGE
jgi:Na+/H+ antiporter NhaA